MLFVSKDYGDGTYGITDSTDRVEERHTLEELKGYLTKGVDIKGLNLKTDNVVVYPTIESYFKALMARAVVLGTFSKSSKDAKDWYLRKDDEEWERYANLLDFSAVFVFEDAFKVLSRCISLAQSPDTDYGVSVPVPDDFPRFGQFFPEGRDQPSNFRFRQKDYLKRVTVPDFVTKIGERAFSKLRLLGVVEVPNSVTEIEEEAFYDCRNLWYVILPDTLTKIGDYAFRCTNISEITIPDSVTEIGSGAFVASSLRKVVLPNSITELASELFTLCRSLASCEIPDSVTKIGDSAFANCYGLISVTVPDSVTEIGDKAFVGCPFLKVECNRGSYAEEYCKSNSVKYELL